jgi:hypothetical protein
VLLGCLEVAEKSSNEQRTTVDLIAAGPPPESAADMQTEACPALRGARLPSGVALPFTFSASLSIDSLQVQSTVPAIGARHCPISDEPRARRLRRVESVGTQRPVQCRGDLAASTM